MKLFNSKEKSGSTSMRTEMPPTFYPIDVSELKLAPYQRGIRRHKAKAYADNYDPDIFGIILVSHRGGKYYIIDGQHRVEACKIRGIKTVWCQVLEGLNYQQEAEKFYKTNTCRTPLNANHKFNALVEREDENALNVVRALQEFGFYYSKEGNESAENCVCAVSSLQKIYKNNGYTGLCEVLEIIRKAWNGEKTSTRAEILKGLNTFINNYTFSKAMLIKVLEKDTPMGIIDRAKSATNNIQHPSRSDGTCFHIAKTIRDMYDDMAIKNKKATCSYRIDK